MPTLQITLREDTKDARRTPSLKLDQHRDETNPRWQEMPWGARAGRAISCLLTIHNEDTKA